ncbi:MAG: hypothetical protein WCA85_20425 [Paraburkholderia sp.]|uniref:hypothetical protein n=1 Tax=Paraburkholderia sp. TaxID=1926495 RepID=UPI003C49245D
MKMPDFLMAHSATDGRSNTFAIGETGFSFDNSQRPAATLNQWVSGEDIPDAARKVLERHGQFKDVTGLIRVPTESDAADEVHAEWILVRTSSGLVSIVVRDANTCEPSQLQEDMAFAVVEAKRYCASSVVVLVQESRHKEPDSCRTALQKVFKTASVNPDQLYASNIAAELPVWFASVSTANR